MTDQKLEKIVAALLEKSKTGKFGWEDVSEGDDEVFRTLVGVGLVRIARRREQWRDGKGTRRRTTYIEVWVYGCSGQELAHAEYSDGSSFLKIANELVDVARAQSRNSEAELDDMLQVLRNA